MPDPLWNEHFRVSQCVNLPCAALQNENVVGDVTDF